MTDYEGMLENILTEWAFKVSDGKPDPKNFGHQMLLREVLVEFEWPVQAINEFITNLKGDRVEPIPATPPIPILGENLFVGIGTTLEESIELGEAGLVESDALIDGTEIQITGSTFVVADSPFPDYQITGSDDSETSTGILKEEKPGSEWVSVDDIEVTD